MNEITAGNLKECEQVGISFHLADFQGKATFTLNKT